MTDCEIKLLFRSQNSGVRLARLSFGGIQNKTQNSNPKTQKPKIIIEEQVSRSQNRVNSFQKPLSNLFSIPYFEIKIEKAMKERLVYNYFTDDEFLRISNKIKEIEKITSGELRVSIKEERPRFNKKSVRELAEEEFYKLGMDKTRDKTGIIIYMLLNENQFYILADSGINEKVEQSTWDKVRDEMQSSFKRGDFGKGVVLGVEKVGNILAKYFPIKSDDTNELSNKVVL